jgi:DNA-directed RNA polymerase subunit RPC12/RpoP
MATDKPKKTLIIKKKAKSAKGSGKKKRPIRKIKKPSAAAEHAEVRAKTKALTPSDEPAPAPEPAREEVAAEDFSFYCPYCAKPNQVAHALVGTAISCESCGNPVTVPPPLAEAPVETAETGASRAIFKFYCSVCGQKLSALVENVGAHTVCPGCNSTITVPENQPAPPESTDTATDADDAAGDTFKFHCQSCGKKFEARHSWAGRPFVCPACDAELIVPDPPD